MIAQKYRFHGHASIKYLLHNGKQVRNKLTSIKYVDNNRRHYSRVAIIVSKKVAKHAVDRNRIRRRMYEIIREQLPAFKRTVDLAVFVYNDQVAIAPAADLSKEINSSLKKAELI